MEDEELLVRRLQDERAAKTDEAVAAVAREHALAEEARRRFIADVETLVPAAIERLREAGWPGAQLVKVDGRQGWPLFLKGGKLKEVAGWAVGSFTYHDYHGTGGNVDPIYLLPDGRWIGGSYGGRSPIPRSFREVVDSMRDQTRRIGVRLINETPRGVLDNLRAIASGDLSGFS